MPFFHRLMDAVRTLDPSHILFIEGNTYARDLKGFDPAWKTIGFSIRNGDEGLRT